MKIKYSFRLLMNSALVTVHRFALGVIVVTNNLVTALQTCLRLGGVNVGDKNIPFLSF